MTSRGSSAIGARTREGVVLVWAALFALSLLLQLGQLAAPPSALATNTGAIWTTLADCTKVNINVGFASKQDVYLNGGPSGGGPGLADGNYYVKVEAPGGTLLGKSTSANVVVVGGHISSCYRLWDLVKQPASFSDTGYLDTDNNGGEYKVTISQDAEFSGGTNKSDNFKVRSSAPTTASLTVVKHVVNGNAIASNFTMIVSGVTVTGGNTFAGSEDGVTVEVTPGTFGVTESGPSGYVASYVGCSGTIAAGQAMTCTITNTFTDAPTYCINVTKLSDNGTPNNLDDDRPLAGAAFTVATTTAEPIVVAGPASTDGEGTITFCGLLAGDYQVTETGVPSGYSGSFSQTVSLPQVCEQGTECGPDVSLTVRNTPGCQILANCPPQVVLTPGLRITKGVGLAQAGPFAESLTTTAGTIVWFQVTATNAGQTPLSGVTVTDSLTLPASCPAVPAVLNVGGSYTCTYSRVAAVGTTVNTATADSDQTGPATDSATVTAFSGGVAGATATPKLTLPPTDSLDPVSMSSSGPNLGLILLVLAGLATMLGFITPVTSRGRRRNRRG